MSFKSGKIEINYQRRAFKISLIFHGVIIFLIFSMNNTFVHKDNFVVVDFTLEDSLKVEAGTSKHVRSLLSRERAPMNHVVNIEGRKTPLEEEKSSVADTMARIEPSEIQGIKPAPSEETESHGVSFSEQLTASEDKSIQDTASVTSIDASYGAVGLIDRDTTKTDVKTAYGAGSGNTIEGKKTGYLRANFSYIKDMIERRITYPDSARRMGWKGNVKVSFIISSSGHVRDIRLIQSSGYGILDNNVIEAVKDASPFPKPPVEAQIIIPIVYNLN
jgi:TonB family protein